MRYFNLRKDAINGLTQSLYADLKSGGLPFMAALEVMVTLKKSWAFIDRSVGLATGNQKSFQSIISVPGASLTGAYFNPQDAGLIKPFTMPKREIPVYTSSSSSAWSFGNTGGSARSSRSHNGDDAP